MQRPDVEDGGSVEVAGVRCPAQQMRQKNFGKNGDLGKHRCDRPPRLKNFHTTNLVDFTFSSSQLPGLDSFHKQKMSPLVPVKPWLPPQTLRVGAASAIKFKVPSYGAIGAEQRFYKNQLLCPFLAWLQAEFLFDIG